MRTTIERGIVGSLRQYPHHRSRRCKYHIDPNFICDHALSLGVKVGVTAQHLILSGLVYGREAQWQWKADWHSLHYATRHSHQTLIA